jgi:uncharacterized protein YegL
MLTEWETEIQKAQSSYSHETKQEYKYYVFLISDALSES